MKGLRAFLVLMLAAIMTLSFSIVVFADEGVKSSDGTITRYLRKYANTYEDANSIINRLKEDKEEFGDWFSDDYQSIKDRQADYDEIYYVDVELKREKSATTAKTVKIFYGSQDMIAIKKAINNINLEGTISDVTDGMSITPDIKTGTGILSGVIPYINIATGIIIALVTIGIAAFTALDILYISFPVFQTKCEEARQSGNSKMVNPNKVDKQGKPKLRWISVEAQRAVEQAETSENPKQPHLYYIWKRAVTYIALALVIYIFATGRFEIILELALKLASGGFDALETLNN